MPDQPQPLSELKGGESGAIVEVTAPPDHRGRLFEMGLVPGTRVAVERFGLLGDPVEIKVRGYHLTLRRAEAGQILVRRS